MLKILEKGAVGLLICLDSIVYGLVGKAYMVFMAVAGARLLTSEAYTQVANKIYIIVGVLMLFVLSYSILRSIIDPDKNLKEELGGKMVQRVIVAVVGLAMCPFVFNLLYQAQGLILDNNIIGNLFFNDQVLEDGTDPDAYVGQLGGYVTATSLWQAFFYPSEESGLTAAEIESDPSEYLVGSITSFAACAAFAAAAFLIPVANLLFAGAAVASCINGVSQAGNYSEHADDGKLTLQDAYARTSAGDSFSLYTVFIDNYIDEGEITYLWLVSTICGGFALYAFISFSIDMGVRAAKMAYLQIVAPIPLIMQVIPSNKGMFDTYLKSVKNTFLEVFIRVSVVYVVIYIICHLQNLFGSTKNLWGNQELGPGVKFFAMACLILGLIAFCRSAPKIISETLGIKTDGVKLGLRDKLAEGGAFGAGAILGGGISSAVQGFNKEKFDKDHKFRSIAKKMGHGARGLFGGAARAGWNQYGVGGKEAKSFGEARDAARKASEAEGDAISRSIDRAKRRKDAQTRLVEAQKEVERTKREEAAAKASGDQDRIKKATAARIEAEKEVAEAKKKIWENTPEGEWLTERGKRIKVWASGTVDLSVEDTAIKVGNAMGTIQDKLRAEAAKKDAQSKALQGQLEDYQAQAQKLSEYKEGWSEETYNRELQERMKKDARYTAANQDLHAAQTRLISARTAKAQLDAQKASGAIDQATYDARVVTIDADISQAETDVQTHSLDLDNIRREVVAELDAVAKFTPAELTERRQELQVKIDASKKLMEARQDEWVQEQLAANNTELLAIVNGELREYMDFFDKHPNFEVTVGMDDAGQPIKRTIQQVVEGNFGAGAMTGSVKGGSFNKETAIEIKLQGGGKETFTFVPSGNKDIPGVYRDASGRELSPGEYAQHINSLLGSITDIKSSTASAVAKDQGKQARINIQTSEDYAKKNEIRRQAQEGKK